jgi:rfaE bifunctional protein kinase chain/domain
MNINKAKLIQLVDRFAGKKVAVWGDFILDEYLYGTTRRISREAPVLILSYQNKEFSLGGAGNSLQNIKALDAEPFPIGVLGDDDAGKKILELLRTKGISTDYLLIEKNYQTPIKTRIFAGEDNTRKQQILRIDQEAKVPESPALDQKILKFLVHAQKRCCALLVSDYNYFTVKEDIFNKMLPVYEEAKTPITLDSRFRLLNFKGVTVATPNEPEVEQALKIELHDDSELVLEAGRTILKGLHSPALLITRGSKGMILFEKGKPAISIPVHGTTDIVDVTGAGDTVISVFTLALASGASFKDAALLSNYAGGLAVMKKGTSTLTPQELKQAILS